MTRVRKVSCALIGVCVLKMVFAVSSLSAQTVARTRVVVLGVVHSGQLVAESYQPAVFRAFYDRVQPAAIAVERSPTQLARNDHYEFTYEIQHLTLPYARDRNIPVHGFDWYPSTDDQVLGFGVDLEAPPIVRPAEGFQAFITFQDTAGLRRPLLYAEAPGYGERQSRWEAQPAQPASLDLARRLFLYRTFLQARYVGRIAANYRGKTLLVIVGDQHKGDIESILSADPSIEIVPPASIGAAEGDAVTAAVTAHDLYAIASFNLLGLQPTHGPVDWHWLDRTVDRLSATASAEVELFKTRLGVLRGALGPTEAGAAYARIVARGGQDTRFTWNGVKDARRLDSYFDPFGNLKVAQRAALEEARERYKAGQAREGDAIKATLEGQLSSSQRAQLGAYWNDYVVRTR